MSRPATTSSAGSTVRRTSQNDGVSSATPRVVIDRLPASVRILYGQALLTRCERSMPLSAFHPTVQRWFTETFGEPTPPQLDGWPRIAAGKHVLIAAPTGSGKTLAAFLYGLDLLLRQGTELRDETQVLYISPLRALSNDVQKNLAGPLAELRARDPTLPEVRVVVRTGDTPQSQRQAMVRRPPHVLVTTPESLYLLLTTGGGRKILRTVKTVILDEVHAVVGDKRGCHLALSLERLVALAGEFQRIGLSATQKPIARTAGFVAGPHRPIEIVDSGHFRKMDVAIEIPRSPLQTICSHEVWGEVYERIAELVRAHQTTLVFVNTRKLAERVSAQLSKLLGEAQVGCHHSSLSKERRLDAEQRLKRGELKALVATASLELGIDIGDIDLVVQVGSTRAIATFLQRVGRAGHMIRKIPKGRLFPVTIDELVESAALLRAVKARQLDQTPNRVAPLDILAQQIVAACVGEAWSLDGLFAATKRAWHYRDLERADFDKVVALHTEGRHALLHKDGVNGRLMATKRARLVALQSGGAIPDVADWQVLLEPEGTFVGTVHEDFAIESSGGDIFQLGNTSWQIVRQERGTLRVIDAKGVPPTLPFWVAEAPGRTRELSEAVGELREEVARLLDPRTNKSRQKARETGARQWLIAECAVDDAAAEQIVEQIRDGRDALGCVPTHRRLVLERFFDESGGMQLVLHAPFGSRINRAYGLALRKCFCRGFGFELQAAAGEDAIVISLGTMHSFPLAEVFDYLSAETVRDLLAQAILAQPMFPTRWRWNATRSLVLERARDGKRVPAPLQRMRAEDLLAGAFPQAIACGETLPPGDREIPWEHPLVRQTMEDCLTEALDVDGLIEVLTQLKSGAIERVALDTVEPSAFARGVLSLRPYAFLDDAPLEERRTQAVLSRRSLPRDASQSLGALSPDAVARVREEAWPTPQSAEEVHEALLWMGWITATEAVPWQAWLEELRAAGRVRDEAGRWVAVDGPTDPLVRLRGRLEAIGPYAKPADEEIPLLFALEQQGVVLRTQLDGRQAWCERRLLARIHRDTLDRLRQEIEAVSIADYQRFLAAWQHAEPATQLDGPAGLQTVIEQLAGYEVPAAAWERHVLPRRLKVFRREWLDQLAMSGDFAWGRLWSSGSAAIRVTPIALLARRDLERWRALAPPADVDGITGPARDVLEALAQGGAMFPRDLQRAAHLLESHFEGALQELVARGAITCDSFGALRQLIVPPSRRRLPVLALGRWSLFRSVGTGAPPPAAPDIQAVEFVARQLLRRWGVVVRRVVARERLPVPWRDLVRCFRSLELRGEIRGGRFVAGVDGEQFALPDAVTALRKRRRLHRAERESTAAAAEAHGDDFGTPLAIELPGKILGDVSPGDPLEVETQLGRAVRGAIDGGRSQVAR
ncbi:MAG: DEAD/DEAH box helicase [Planctomycetes bacterium]|nr:DEAD/DEAH box helicase [Planctomycetota bacterium]